MKVRKKEMTLKEAVLKTLGELEKPAKSSEIYEHILSKQYYKSLGKTPENTNSAKIRIFTTLTQFIKEGDKRIRRIKPDGGGVYVYYLTKHEKKIETASLPISTQQEEKGTANAKTETYVEKTETYAEKDLHKLLSTYLKNTQTYSKTISHEQSKSGKDNNQIWTHPDMVSIKFLKSQTQISQNFLKSINSSATFTLSSYEVKKEITSDAELKKTFFQAVSNSSWANYGYLVAFEFSDSLTGEMERLNQSFGIGIVELNANPYQSKILFPAKYRELDITTMDKLCKVNKDFAEFIEQIEKLMTAQERYYKAIEREFEEFCDSYFETDTDIEKYCRDKNIPNNL